MRNNSTEYQNDFAIKCGLCNKKVGEGELIRRNTELFSQARYTEHCPNCGGIVREAK